jgi:hypothetical protein
VVDGYVVTDREDRHENNAMYRRYLTHTVVNSKQPGVHQSTGDVDQLPSN